MSFDLTNHMPLGEPFTDEGFTFHAYQPANARADRIVVLRAFRGDELLREVQVQLFYPNTFGIDVADMAAINTAMDELFGDLLEGSA